MTVFHDANLVEFDRTLRSAASDLGMNVCKYIYYAALNINGCRVVLPCRTFVLFCH